MKIEHALFALHGAKTYEKAAYKVAYNLCINPVLIHRFHPTKLVELSHEDMAKGTLIEHVQAQQLAQTAHFEKLLKSKGEEVP
eukprot:1474305-Pleurochrysis_carterae.AAC.1